MPVLAHARRLIGLLVLTFVVGAISGLGSWALFESLDRATETRLDHGWLVWLLPIAAGLLGAAYWKFGGPATRGTSLVIAHANGTESADVPARMAPMIFAATFVAQLTGASVGREGAALQIGGSVTALLTKPFRLRDDDRRLLTTAAIAGSFGGAFGVPVAGAIFGIEVQRTGRLRYERILVALVSSFTADFVVEGLGRSTPLTELMVDVDWWFASRLVVVGVAAGLAARLFIASLGRVRAIVTRFAPHEALRPVVGGIATLLLMILVGRDYLGLSLPLVEHALAGDLADWWDPVLKIVFTAVALGCAIPGGEVTPLFVVGATLGSVLSAPLGLPPSITAAACLGAVFGAASNTPLACTILVVELFGGAMAGPAAIVGLVAYAVSPRRGIYSGQVEGDRKDFTGRDRPASEESPPRA